MNEIKSTEVITAIDSYEIYSASLRAILKTLIQLSVNDIANVSVHYLMDQLGYTRATIYNGIKKLQNDDLIIKVRQKNARFDAYQIMTKNLTQIIQLYNNKRSL